MNCIVIVSQSYLSIASESIPNSKSLLNNLMYTSSPSFTTESNQALPAALYSLTYLVRAGGLSSSGFLAAGWVGSLVGA